MDMNALGINIFHTSLLQSDHSKYDLAFSEQHLSTSQHSGVKTGRSVDGKMSIPSTISDLLPFDQALQALHDRQANPAESLQAVATLAEASKTELIVRQRLAEPHALQTLVDIVKCTLPDNPVTASSALRCIGNACIDNDAARDTICGLHFEWAHQCLTYDTNESDDEIRWLTIKVLYNICSDHELAQLHCYEQRIHYPLITICSTSLASSSRPDDRSLLIDLLFWISGQRVEHPPAVTEVLPDEVLNHLLVLSNHRTNDPDLEQFATVMETCLTFLRDPLIQKQIIEAKRVADVWLMLQEMVSRTRNQQLPESEELLKPLIASTIWCLSDMAAHPAFAQAYGLTDPLIEGLLHIIQSGGEETILLAENISVATMAGAQKASEEAQHTNRLMNGHHTPLASPIGPQLLTAACQVIGNLLRTLPTQDVAQLVEESALQKPLWNVFLAQAQTADEDALHSAAGLLIQLTRPSAHVRELMGQDAHAESALTAMCEHKTPQIKQDGIRLLKALGRDCPPNQERFAALAEKAMVTAATLSSGVIEGDTTAAAIQSNVNDANATDTLG